MRDQQEQTCTQPAYLSGIEWSALLAHWFAIPQRRVARQFGCWRQAVYKARIRAEKKLMAAGYDLPEFGEDGRATNIDVSGLPYQVRRAIEKRNLGGGHQHNAPSPSGGGTVATPPPPPDRL